MFVIVVVLVAVLDEILVGDVLLVVDGDNAFDVGLAHAGVAFHWCFSVIGYCCWWCCGWWWLRLH